MKVYAGHLPGINSRDVAWQSLHFGQQGNALEVCVPVLSDAQIASLAASVRDNARRYLHSLSVTRIAALIDQAIAHLLDRSHPLRQQAEQLLPLVTGYDADMLRLGLTGYLKTFREPQLKRFLAEDFGNVQMLDDFQPRPKGGFARAFGPQLLLQVWAGNVPGLPLWSLIAGLLVKAGSVGKVASAEPLMAGWFAQLLAEIDPQLGNCLAVVWWQGGDENTQQRWFSQADVVMAYGGDAALAAMQQRLPPGTRFLPHGHKISFGMVARSALDVRRGAALARQVAYDVMRYDQAGCYSPQALFIERGGRVTPQEFAAYLAHELAALAKRYPRATLTLSESQAVAAWRNAEEIQALSGDRTLYGDASDAWAVVCVDKPEPLQPGALGRTLKVMAVDALEQTIEQVAAQRAYLQSVGLAAAPQALFRLAAQLGAASVTRVTALGNMSSPEAGWHHDGRFSLLDLVTLCEIEQAAETAAEQFAPYVD